MSDNVAMVTAEDFLPVGMLANGRGPAKAMESIAKRKHNVEGWEPFHYEQISTTEFEVTGGVPAVIGGAKKWPEPHTTVIVLNDELTQELHLVLEAQATQENKTNLGKSMNVLSAVSAVISSAQASPPVNKNDDRQLHNSMPKYMTVILRLPDDTAGHLRITEMLALNKNFFGADVVATAFQNDVMVSKSLQE